MLTGRTSGSERANHSERYSANDHKRTQRYYLPSLAHQFPSRPTRKRLERAVTARCSYKTFEMCMIFYTICGFCVFLNINRSHLETNLNRKSRYIATKHVQGMDLVECLLEAGIAGQRIRIVTQFNNQARLYPQSVVELRGCLHLLQRKTPHVFTADGPVGKESDIVIWDTVVISSNTRTERIHP